MKFRSFLTITIISALLFACSSNKNNDEETLADSNETSQVIEQQKINAQNVFTSIPGPEELSSLIEQTNLDYDASLLNNPDNLSKYSSDNFKAINLGLYGADMVYTNVYEQSQESMLYLKCVNSLCRSLGITGAFDEKTGERLQDNKENKDSLLSIVSKSFTKADEFLRENQRPGTSSLMVAGGWIEGLYLSGKVAEKAKTKKLIQKMSQQKKSISDLITLLENAKVTGDGAFVLEGLKDLQVTYNKIPDNTTMSDEILAEINTKVFALRAKLVLV
ncbi:MAG TPA: hypothetical protein VKG26_16715 [Bacteroidia bacterium]|nr:hypothetical protein [Bacteroidia bacterium]